MSVGHQGSYFIWIIYYYNVPLTINKNTRQNDEWCVYLINGDVYARACNKYLSKFSMLPLIILYSSGYSDMHIHIQIISDHIEKKKKDLTYDRSFCIKEIKKLMVSILVNNHAQLTRPVV